MQDSTGLKNIALTATGLALGCVVVMAPKAAVAEDAIAIASGSDEVEVSEVKRRPPKDLKRRPPKEIDLHK